MARTRCAECDFEPCLCEEIAQAYAEAWDEKQAYIKRGVCSDCGARSEAEATTKCRPQQMQCGEWICGGEELWEVERELR